MARKNKSKQALLFTSVIIAIVGLIFLTWAVVFSKFDLRSSAYVVVKPDISPPPDIHISIGCNMPCPRYGCPSGFICNSDKICRNTQCPAESDCLCPVPTPTPKPTPTPSPTPKPTPTPSPLAKRVFVTSTRYNANLGGLSGADSKCQERANAANLGGTWKAWLSDNTTSASSRLIHSTTLYKLLNNKIVANNWNDLTSKDLQNPITYTEIGTELYPKYNDYPNPFAWTGTERNGQISTYNKCSNWGNYNIGTTGVIGIIGSRDSGWSSYLNVGCDQKGYLYCFEQ